MALAPAAYVLWTRFLRHNPADPEWADRDRFVLSCGHASMLLYSLLHLTGYDLSLEELKASASGARAPRAIPSAATRPGSRPRPVRWARASATPWGWRSPSGSSPSISTGRDTAGGPPDLGIRQRRRSDGGGSERGGLARGAPAAGQAHRGLRRQSHHHRRRHRARLLRRRAAQRSRPTAGTCSGSATATTSSRIEAALEAARAEADRPALGDRLRTYIADPAPTKRDTAEAHGAPLGEEEVRRDQGDHGLADGADVLRARRRACAHWGGRGARRRAPGGVGGALQGLRRRSADLATEFERWHGGLASRGLGPGPAELHGRRRRAGDAAGVGPALQAIAAAVPNLVGGSADLARQHRDDAQAGRQRSDRPRRAPVPLGRARARHGGAS